MTRKLFIISTITFLSSSLLGLTFSITGAGLPAIRQFFTASLSGAGLITSLLQLGFAFFSFVGGLLAAIYRKEKILSLGCFLLSLAALFLGVSPNLTVNLFIVIIMGIGCGLIFSSSNSLIIRLYPGKRGTFLNIHHLFFGFGSLIGPLIMSSMLTKGLLWQLPYKGLGLFALLISVFLLFILPAGKGVERFGLSQLDLIGIRKLITNGDFRVVMLIVFLSIGIQFTLMYLIVTYLHGEKGLSITHSGIMLSLFFVLLALGRIICALLALKLDNSRIILILLLLLAAALSLAWLTKGMFAAIFLVLSGFACSGLFPGLLALASIILPIQLRDSALGLLAMSGGLGGMGFTYFTAFISEKINLSFGFLLLTIISIFTFSYYLFRLKSLTAKE